MNDSPADRLPTFIVAGERRSGTTSVYHWLRQRPDVFMYPWADMDYFIEDECKGIRLWQLDEPEPDAANWERSHSLAEYASKFRAAADRPIIGQKDADLLFWRAAHERLQRYLPACRYIITLRDPIERAWSQYWNEVAKGRETLAFSAALDAEADRSARCAYARNHLSYAARGDYEASLSAFTQHVPRDRIHIMLLERAMADPAAALKYMLEFIGADASDGLERAGERHNSGGGRLPRWWATRGPGRWMRALSERAVGSLTMRLPFLRASGPQIRDRVRRMFTRNARPGPVPDADRARLQKQLAPAVERLRIWLDDPIPEWADWTTA